MNKARELFMQYGVRNISMDDIASSLGISKKTIYQNFKDKDALVMHTMEGILEYNKTLCLPKTTAKNAIHEAFIGFEYMMEVFRKINFSVLNELKKYHPKTYRKFQAYRDEFLLGVIKESIQRGIDEGLFREDINTDILARIRVEALFISFQPEFYNPMQMDPYEVNQQLFHLFMYGMATAKGYRLIEKYKQ